MQRLGCLLLCLMLCAGPRQWCTAFHRQHVPHPLPLLLCLLQPCLCDRHHPAPLEAPQAHGGQHEWPAHRPCAAGRVLATGADCSVFQRWRDTISRASFDSGPWGLGGMDKVHVLLVVYMRHYSEPFRHAALLQKYWFCTHAPLCGM